MIDAWINTNEQANDDPLEHYYDVEVAIDCHNTIVFRCGIGMAAKEHANRLKQAIAEAEDIEYNQS